MNNLEEKPLPAGDRKIIGYGFLLILASVLTGFLLVFTEASVEQLFGAGSPAAQIFSWFVSITVAVVVIGSTAIFIIKFLRNLVGRK